MFTHKEEIVMLEIAESAEMENEQNLHDLAIGERSLSVAVFLPREVWKQASFSAILPQIFGQTRL